MVIDLMAETMLGHWDISPSISVCEYQFGQRLIYVQHPKGESHIPYVAKAQESVVVAWNDIEKAISFAEQLSRNLIPAFWEVHDKSERRGARLEVYAIHYDLDSPYPSYVIGVSHHFDYTYTIYAEEDLWKKSPILVELPEPPDNFWLSIIRYGENHFEKTN